MTDQSIRVFADDAAIRRVGEGLLDRSLPCVEWTHEAHLAACLWLVRDRRDIDVDAAIAGIIRGYNEAVGGVNDDAQGYHDTITRVYLIGVRLFLHDFGTGGTLCAVVNALLASRIGRRDWPLRLYSRDRLFSVTARRAFVAADISPIAL